MCQVCVLLGLLGSAERVCGFVLRFKGEGEREQGDQEGWSRFGTGSKTFRQQSVKPVTREDFCRKESVGVTLHFARISIKWENTKFRIQPVGRFAQKKKRKRKMFTKIQSPTRQQMIPRGRRYSSSEDKNLVPSICPLTMWYCNPLPEFPPDTPDQAFPTPKKWSIPCIPCASRSRNILSVRAEPGGDKLLVLVPAVSVGLSGPLQSLARARPVDPDARLPMSLRRYCSGCWWDAWGTAAAEEAQSEESGRKMTTRVRTLEDMAGREVKYWRMEKMAE